ncbi:MAG: NADH-quinone oxidoreductase subunit J [bacterium]
MSLTFIFFTVLAVLSIASAVVTISAKNPVVSALALVFHFFMLAGLYLTLNAQFIAAIQILVYAGAIMVLVIFVIMLLNLGAEEKNKEKFSIRKVISVILVCVMIIQFIMIFLLQKSGKIELPENSANLSTVQSIGQVLFTNYLLPFEAIGILLLAAIIGAIVLAKRKLT